jgi:hypothetical protein
MLMGFQIPLVVGAGSSDATTAWVNAVVAAGGTVSNPRKTLIDNLITGLKSDGVWTKLDRLWILAAENSQSALIDLVGLVSATPVGTPNFVVDTGYIVDGTNTVNLNYNPTVGTPHFTQDNSHFGAWNLFNGTSAAELVTDVPISSLMMYPKYTDGKIYTRIQDAWNGLTISDPRGWLAGDRSGSAGRDTYQNGSLFGNVFTGGSGAVHNAPTYLLNGGPCAAVSFGGSLTSANHLALYNRLSTYMTAIVAGFDSATNAWAAAVAATGSAVSYPRKLLVDTLIKGLKTDGIWAKLDRLWIFAVENQKSALIDLVANTTATPVNSPTFTADRGYAGDGSSSYLNSNFNASTSGVQWTLNSAHIAAWDNTSRANSPIVISGAYDGSAVSDLMPWYGGGVVTRINGGGLTGLTNGTSQGFFVGQRTSTSVVEGYRNNALCGSFADGSNHIINLPFFICARNDGGGFSSGMADQVSMVSYGASFTGTEITNYYNRLRTYMTAVGVP